MTSIAFIGLGVMGAPMARHLAQAGHELSLFNRSAEKAAQWVAQYGGRTALSPADAAKQADVVISCVGNDDDVHAIALGDGGAFPAMRPDALWIDHSTISANMARHLAGVAASRDLHFLDAPDSGGRRGPKRAHCPSCAGAATGPWNGRAR